MPDRTLQPCGTTAAYKRHLKRGEPPCVLCLAANRDSARRRRGGLSAPVSCRVCGADLPRTGKRGRPVYFCSDACRRLRRPPQRPDHEYTCERCDKTWVRPATRGQFPKFCSETCAAGARADRRRARMADAYVEDVNRTVVFERDGWVCQLCGEPTDQTKKHPHPLAPTIDHIIPLAAGGTHEPANVQCAHSRCNVRKGARVA